MLEPRKIGCLVELWSSQGYYLPLRMDAAQVKHLIEQGLPGADVEVLDTTGGGDHFEAIVVSDGFDGKSLVERHQMVYAALGEAMRARVHALALKTLTPAQYRNRR